MIIERKLAPFLVFSEDSILTGLRKISANKERIVFCVDAHGRLQGSLSDGDFRRWIVENPSSDLEASCLTIANQAVQTAPTETPLKDLTGMMPHGVMHLPLIDDRGHLVAIAINRKESLHFGKHEVSMGSRAFVIAEIGNNHNGSIDLAKRLVDLAADAGADAVKFQLRDMEALYRNSGTDISSGEDLGPQYTLDLLAKVALDKDKLFQVFDHCRERDIEVLCTPWDSPSVQALMDYGISGLKIASADLTNHELLRDAGTRGVPLILSTGMSREDEILESVQLLREQGTSYAMLHCQSTYPAPFKDVNLSYMGRLAEISQSLVGYSGHERGIHIPVAAVALGAKIIEKHFTVDRTMEGNDHTVSLLPDEFSQMVQQIRQVEEAIGTKAPRVVSTGEMMNRVNLAKSLVSTKAITAGTVITEADVAVKSPGRGLQPNSLPRLLGRVVNRDIAEGDFFYEGDLNDAEVLRRTFTFRRPWGIPARFHDFAPLLEDSNLELLEFHFSYKDLDMDVTEVFDKKLPVSFANHSPELFEGDFLLDLASEDSDHWERSIHELQRVVDTTRQMKQFFTCDLDPVVIVNVGGFTKDSHLPATRRAAMYQRVADGLNRVDFSGTRLGIQTMPPYPWLMGGQMFHNLFVDAQETVDFAKKHGRRLTLDISHSKLAANFANRPFSEYVELLAPYTDHLHIVDATGVDGEGVQVGEGEVDWPQLAEQLDRLSPEVSFIPEIWQGHVNDGEGFWTALDRMEEWF